MHFSLNFLFSEGHCAILHFFINEVCLYLQAAEKLAEFIIWQLM